MRTPCLRQSQPGPGNSLLQTHRKAKAPYRHPAQPSVHRNDLEGTVVVVPQIHPLQRKLKSGFTHPSGNPIPSDALGQFTGPPKKEELRTAGGNVVRSKLASGTGPHSRCPARPPTEGCSESWAISPTAKRDCSAKVLPAPKYQLQLSRPLPSKVRDWSPPHPTPWATGIPRPPPQHRGPSRN